MKGRPKPSQLPTPYVSEQRNQDHRRGIKCIYCWRSEPGARFCDSIQEAAYCADGKLNK